MNLMSHPSLPFSQKGISLSFFLWGIIVNNLIYSVICYVLRKGLINMGGTYHAENY